MGAKGSRGLATWLAVAPCLLAAGLGTGFAKPDFWSEDLRIPTYHAVRPVPAGTWVLAKFRVAAGSVLLAWLLVGVVGGVLLSWAGDRAEIASWWEKWRTRYPADRGLAGGVSVVGIAVMLTWRLLVQNAWASLSGRKLWHRMVGAVTGAALLAQFVALISGDGASAPTSVPASNGHGAESSLSHLDALWPSGMAELLLIGIFAKAALAAWAWIRADQRGWFTFREIAIHFGTWLGGTALAALGPLLLFPDAPATRALGCLACLLLVPLAGPALAARALETNRRGG